MIITFVGHARVSASNKVKDMVKAEIRKNIKNDRSVSCYLGGYGDFDDICACACRELKQEYAGIEVVYIAPYITISEQAKIKELRKNGLYDNSIYPPIENAPLRLAIPKRNEWMVTNADLIIAYVNYGYGGAYRSLQVAKRRKKKIINICDLI